MHLLFVLSSPDKVDYVEALTNAATRAGHNVTVFFNEDSVKLLKAPSRVEYLYADLLACRASSTECGITKDQMVSNARMSSLAELVDLLEGSNRVVFLG